MPAPELQESTKELIKQRRAVQKGTPEWKQLTGEIAENRKELKERIGVVLSLLTTGLAEKSLEAQHVAAL